jgi:hypothetical protein
VILSSVRLGTVKCGPRADDPGNDNAMERSEEAVLRGQAGGNQLRDGILTFANLGNVRIAKDSSARRIISLELDSVADEPN